MHATWSSVWIYLIVGWWWICSSYCGIGNSLQSLAPNHCSCLCLTEVLLKLLMTYAFVVFGNTYSAYESSCVLWVYYCHVWKLQEAYMVSSTLWLEFGAVSEDRYWSGGRCCFVICAWLVICFILALQKLSVYQCPYIWTGRQESPVWLVKALTVLCLHLSSSTSEQILLNVKLQKRVSPDLVIWKYTKSLFIQQIKRKFHKSDICTVKCHYNELQHI